MRLKLGLLLGLDNELRLGRELEQEQELGLSRTGVAIRVGDSC